MKIIKKVKVLKKIIGFFVLLNFISCTPYSYFQIYDIKTESNTQNTIFQDENIKIEYNFWANMGNEDFYVYNKTDKNIYINLELSHLIINDYAITYFKNREWSSSKSNSLSKDKSHSISSDYYYLSYPYAYPFNATTNNSTNISTSTQYGTKWIEQKIIVLPPKSKKKINGNVLNSMLFANCDNERYPFNSKHITKIKFNKATSPLKYINYITYSFDNKFNTPIIFKNEFWVKGIKFVPYNDFYTNKYNVHCGVEDGFTTKYYNYANSSGFYVEYKKGALFINLNENNIEDNKEPLNDKTKNEYKIGDKVIYKSTFGKYDAKIVEIKNNDIFVIKYTNRNGKEITKEVSHLWLMKK